MRLVYCEKKGFSKTMFDSAVLTKSIESSVSQFKNHKRFCAINYARFRTTVPHYERLWLSNRELRKLLSPNSKSYIVFYKTILSLNAVAWRRFVEL